MSQEQQLLAALIQFNNERILDSKKTIDDFNDLIEDLYEVGRAGHDLIDEHDRRQPLQPQLQFLIRNVQLRIRGIQFGRSFFYQHLEMLAVFNQLGFRLLALGDILEGDYGRFDVTGLIPDRVGPEFQ